MKHWWPFRYVRQDVYDDTVRDLRERLTRAEQRNADLTEKLVHFKLTGGQVADWQQRMDRAVAGDPTIAAEGRPLPDGTPPPNVAGRIRQAIEENPRVANNPALRRYLLSHGAEQVAAGRSIAAVEREIRRYAHVPNDRVDDADDDEGTAIDDEETLDELMDEANASATATAGAEE
ncbi:MAG TPA: hypothetical protein VNN79_15390 [Actinomycetota bacterium]|nr:hypothetical protein [Actinomycetota bacterium]